MREAAQALLLAELRRIGDKGRKKLIADAAKHMPNLTDASSGSICLAEPDYELVSDNGGMGRAYRGMEFLFYSVRSLCSWLCFTAPLSCSSYPWSDISVSYISCICLLDEPQLRRVNSERRILEATAIIMLGVIGSEFGGDLLDFSDAATTSAQGLHSLTRHTS